jgi:hypothetical protein
VAEQNGQLTENNLRTTDLVHDLSDVGAFSVHNEVRSAQGFVIRLLYLYGLHPSLTWQTS